MMIGNSPNPRASIMINSGSLANVVPQTNKTKEFVYTPENTTGRV
jgi:hypothetical protein